MKKRKKTRFRFQDKRLFAAILLLAVVSSARAALDRVTLASGAVIECTGASIVGGRVQIQLSKGMMVLPVDQLSDSSKQALGLIPSPAGTPAAQPNPNSAGAAPVGPGVQAAAPSPSVPDKTVLQAWEKVRQKVEGTSKNLLVAGNSGGSSMAERFALAYPGKVDGVVLVSGWRYEPMTKPNSIAWCLVHTRGDRREEANRELAAQGRSLGLNMLYAINPPVAGDKKGFERHEVEDFHHSADEAGFAIANQFLVAIRDLRLKGKDWAKSESWPFVAKLSENCAIGENTAMKEDADPRLFFPSGNFVATWQSNENRFPVVSTPRGRGIEVLVRYPRGLPPKGIVLFGGGATSFPAYQGDDMDFLAMQGFIVVGAPSAEDVGVDEWEAIANWIASGPQWSSLPISLVGFEDAGRDFLILAPRLKDDRFRAVAAVDAPLLVPREELSPVKALALTRQTVLLASMDPDPGKREPFLGYMKAAGETGFKVEIIPTPAESPSSRFDLLESISRKLR